MRLANKTVAARHASLHWVPARQRCPAVYFFHLATGRLHQAAMWGDGNQERLRQQWLIHMAERREGASTAPEHPAFDWLVASRRSLGLINPAFASRAVLPDPMSLRVDLPNAQIPWAFRKLRPCEMLQEALGLYSARWAHSDSVEVAQHDPAELTRLGYRLARLATRRVGIDSQEFFAALVTMGIGIQGLPTGQTCTYCFRQARPWSNVCTLHSQAKLACLSTGSTRGRHVASARAAKDVTAAVKGDFQLLRRPLMERSEFFNRELHLGGILWPLHGDALHDWHQSLDRSLSRSPRVCALLGHGFAALPYWRQIARLQEALRDQEWVAWRWPALIELAETWMTEGEKLKLQQRPSGPSPENIDRIAKIDLMLSEGLAKAQIAAALGVSPSHLSHLIRRHKHHSSGDGSANEVGMRPLAKGGR